MRTAPSSGLIVFVSQVRRPGPPQDAEQQQPFDEAGPGRILDDEAGHLREREDEDQVEEELQRRDAFLAALVPSRLRRHTRS